MRHSNTAQNRGKLREYLTCTDFGQWSSLRGRGREFPAEQFAVAVVLGPGQQFQDDGFGVGDFALASGVVEVAAETGEGGQAEAGFDDALDDVGRFRGLRMGVQSLATAWAMRRSLMMASSRANLRLRASMRRRSWEMVMGIPRRGSFAWMDRMDGIRDWIGTGMVAILLKSRSFPLISFRLSRAFGGLWGRNGGW